MTNKYAIIIMTTTNSLVVVEEDENNVLWRSYPQPSSSRSGEPSGESIAEPYRYLLYEDAELKHFPKHKKLAPETLVWVLLSKGKQKTPKLFERARVMEDCDDENKIIEGRVKVEYPSGSTYNVRRKHLVPVFEHLSNLILVASETNDYRRMSTVHTRKEDHFIEIGCDFGILVDSVDASSSLGIDKSEESIRIANERYPTQKFLLHDVFEDDPEILPSFEMDDGKTKTSLVVAIDINGNRELPAVLNCIQFVLDRWSPRLVMVKSRELHAKMVHEKQH